MTYARILGGLVGLAIVLSGSPPAAAQCDASAPQLTSLDFNPKTVDVSGGDQTVTFTFDVLDDVSGIDLVGVSLESPSTVQTVGCNSDTPVSGTPTGGTYECTVTLPEFSESGTWLVDRVSLTDRVSRSGGLSTGELLLLGAPVQLQVVSVPDVAPPVLTGLTLTPTAVDVTGGPSQVECAVTATDNLAGISIVFCNLNSPVVETGAGCAQLIPESGTPTNGVFRCTFDVPQYAESGSWGVSIDIGDAVDNTVSYSTADLTLAGLPDFVTVTSNPEDVSPPVLVDFDLQPGSVNVENQDQTVTCRARLTDDLSGTASFGCGAVFIDAQFNIVSQACVSLAPESGTPNDGIWACDLPIPQYSPGGTWGFVSTVFFDVLQNADAADTVVLQAGGFPTTFDVICDNAGPGPGPLITWLNGSVVTWGPVTDAIRYSLYGGPLSLLLDLDGNGVPDAGYGLCRNGEDGNTTDTLFVDVTVPPPGDGTFLLIGYDTLTQQNLGLGTSSGGLARSPAVPCP